MNKNTTKNTWVISYDTYDKLALCYMLYRISGDNFEIVLSKVMRDETEFKQEIRNITRYFNARLIGDKEL